MFLLSTAQMAAVGAATEAMTLEVWLPGTALKAVTVLFVGVVGSGLGFLAMSWCVERRGPVFTTAFMPLIQMIAAGINVTVLHEQLRLGSVVGSAVVVVGLYLVLWGRATRRAANPSCLLLTFQARLG
ncbi:hypothetical protein ZWY2020_015284 [Hordeum vulgare]|nr:hypothetical protein ZWY2020_015284 [Hordeum vulgare]